MHRDFKIGLVVGLVLLIIAMGWIAGHESLSTDARLAREQSPPAAPPETPPAEAPLPPAAEPNVGEPTVAPLPLAVESDTKIETTPIFSSPVEALDVEEGNEPASPPEPEPVYHLVGEGQSLSTIAMIHYGSSAQWKRILAANPSVIQDAHKIRPGMRLLIPPLED